MANIIEEKSFAFAIRIVNLYKHLNEALIYISHGGENEKTFNLFFPDTTHCCNINSLPVFLRRLGMQTFI